MNTCRYFFRPLLLFFFLFSPGWLISQKIPLYRDSALPVTQRVQDLLKRMTPEEKFWQLYMIPGDLGIGRERLKNGIYGLQIGARGETTDAAGQMLSYGSGSSASRYAARVNEVQSYFTRETRLGIPVIPFAEALHGLVMPGAVVFPQSIALAASWDTALMHTVASAIAEEARSRGIRQVLGPVINIARDVRWGRVEETYGEDPFLTSLMGNACIRAFETQGVVTTPKHFAVNSGEGGRDSYPVDYSHRILEEVYFPAFRSAVTEAGARSVMSAYNSLNGSPCTAHDWLLNEKLKNEWGFRGVVVSDACAVGGANVLHMTAADYAEATAGSLNAGLDVIFQTEYDHYTLFKEAFDKGMIPEEVIDSAVARVLSLKFALGLFEDPFTDTLEAGRINGSTGHLEIALQAAREGIVLLKNDKHTLPLKKKARIAVIGRDAAEARPGGYSGPGIQPVSILDGIRSRSGHPGSVLYAPGVKRDPVKYLPVATENLVTIWDGKQVQGLTAEYFDNIDLSGDPAVTRIDPSIDFAWTLYPPDPALLPGWYSVRWTGKLISPVTGTVRLGIAGNDGYRLYFNGNLVIDNWNKRSFGENMIPLELVKGQRYDLRIEYHESSGSARFRLVWDTGAEDHSEEEIAAAVRIAGGCDVAVVVAGISEGEFNDRALLSLPGRQEDLIRALCATGKPVVVVLIGGSAVTMGRWEKDATAILDAWYPGEMGGKAVAEVLFGDYNPAGRLPITFPVSEGQLPLVYNHKPTGRGDDYTDLTGMPLYPFGYGLSYTNFDYSDMILVDPEIGSEEETTVRFTVKNTGSRAGDEVCQLYIRDEISSVVRPVMELKAFRRIRLEPEEETEVSFRITPEMLSMYDRDLKKIVEPGTFRIMIGASSLDIRLRGMLSVKQ